jgi:hypothetical protein
MSSSRNYIISNFYISQDSETYSVNSSVYGQKWFKEKYLVISEKSSSYVNHLVNNEIIDEVELFNSNHVKFKFNNEFWLFRIDHNDLAEAVLDNCVNGSKIKGPFTFVKIKDGYRLIRQESELYKQIVKRNERDSKSKIRSKFFNVGDIYVTPSGNRSVYLGKVNTYTSSAFKETFVKNKKLFYIIGHEESKRSDKRFSSLISFINGETISDNFTFDHNFEFKTNHSFVEKVDSVNIPSDFLQKIRDYFRESFKNKLIDHADDEWYMKSHVKWDYRFYCPLMNAALSNEKIDKFNFTLFLALA